MQVVTFQLAEEEALDVELGETGSRLDATLDLLRLRLLRIVYFVTTDQALGLNFKPTLAVPLVAGHLD